ncbi:hypothetical protein [Paenibacillus aceti]|uniref:Uncharacterized protein n=1 Tax=Paenibacillus aceti TaxID=1820010 RepID=A0ABQ1W682_9BACL|nr:hypothetical protein [Paenibacillus aceti]GGG14213.1 hypothetical protein GCM10010913_40010 [Paenibacillus aceti]
MLLKKKNVIISFVLAFILAASGYYYFAIYNSVHDVYLASDYKGFSSAEALFSEAELVVIGSPIKDFEDRKLHLTRFSTGHIEDIVTFTEIKVEKVLKGPEEDGVDLTVIEPIGIYQTFEGKKRIARAGYTEMKKGSQYVIFLSKNAFGQYGVINMQAGKFNLDGTDPADILAENSNKQTIFTELTTNYAQELK